VRTSLARSSSSVSFALAERDIVNIIAPLTIFLAFTGHAAAQDLSRYADHDLRKLPTNAIALLQSEFKTKTTFSPWRELILSGRSRRFA